MTSFELLERLERAFRAASVGSLLAPLFPPLNPVAVRGREFEVSTQLWMEGWYGPVNLRTTNSNLTLMFCIGTDSVPEFLQCRNQPTSPTALVCLKGKLCELIGSLLYDDQLGDLVRKDKEAIFRLQQRMSRSQGRELEEALNASVSKLNLNAIVASLLESHDFEQSGQHLSTRDVVEFLAPGESVDIAVIRRGLTSIPFVLPEEQIYELLDQAFRNQELTGTSKSIRRGISEQDYSWSRRAMLWQVRRFQSSNSWLLDVQERRTLAYLADLFRSSQSLNTANLTLGFAWLHTVQAFYQLGNSRTIQEAGSGILAILGSLDPLAANLTPCDWEAAANILASANQDLKESLADVMKSHVMGRSNLKPHKQQSLMKQVDKIADSCSSQLEFLIEIIGGSHFEDRPDFRELGLKKKDFEKLCDYVENTAKGKQQAFLRQMLNGLFVISELKQWYGEEYDCTGKSLAQRFQSLKTSTSKSMQKKIGLSIGRNGSNKYCFENSG